MATTLLLGDWDIKYLHHQGEKKILGDYTCKISPNSDGTLKVLLILSDETELELQVMEFLPGISTFIRDEGTTLYMGSIRLLMTGNILIIQGFISRRRPIQGGGDDMGSFTATKPIGTVYS